jgi:DUF1365 family protein
MTISVFWVHRMVGNDFNPAIVILCHDSIGAVAYVRSSRLYDENVECTKNDPAQSASFRMIS